MNLHDELNELVELPVRLCLGKSPSHGVDRPTNKLDVVEMIATRAVDAVDAESCPGVAVDPLFLLLVIVEKAHGQF